MPFRDHWTLDPEVTFLNHGSFGACPRAVINAQRALQDRLERQPLTFYMRELPDRLDAARAALAEFVGAQADDLVVVPNATTGVNTVLRSLPLGPNDEILTTDHVYGGCRRALEALAAATGVSVVVASVPFPLDGPRAVIDAVTARTSARTRLAVLDHITSPTGIVFPIAELVRELDARGIDTLVDGAHGPGMLPLDLDAIGAAYYTGNAHKWLCTPKGAALLHVRRDRHDRVRPLVQSHDIWRRLDKPGLWQAFDWVGTSDPTAFLCVPEAIAHIATLVDGGWAEVMTRNRTLALSARRHLCDVLDIAPPCPDEMIATLAALPLPPMNPPAAPDGSGRHDPLQDHLLAAHGIEVPVAGFPRAPQRVIRISAQLYNVMGDYEKLGQALLAARA